MFAGADDFMDKVFSMLIEYNRLFRELDNLYHNYAKSCGLSDSTLWILYSIYEDKEIHTQKDLCESWSYSKQTVNSSMKNLIANGYIKLTALSENRKNKQMILTESGEELVQRFIAPLMNAEQNAFSRLSSDEQNKFLKLTKKHVDLLQAEIFNLISDNNTNDV